MRMHIAETVEERKDFVILEITTERYEEFHGAVEKPRLDASIDLEQRALSFASRELRLKKIDIERHKLFANA